jgi:NADPH:quinone reductase-like Zn-dependent oxidoreductase
MPQIERVTHQVHAMKAWAIGRYGAHQPDAMRIPAPQLGPQDVLIRMQGAEIGDWDAVVMSGEWRMDRPFPIVLGLAGAGTVAAVGKQVISFRQGDPVYTYNYPLHHDGCPANRHHNGAWAELMLVPFRHVARAPVSLDLTRAGSLPIAGLTAHETLSDILRVEKHDVVLITGASGGVGHLAVQIATRRGAHVVATARKQNHEFLRGLGAEEVIDYTERNFVDEIHKRYPEGVDKALNGVDGETANQVVRAVRPGGHIVDLTASATAKVENVRVDTDYVVKADADRLAVLARMVDAGELKLEIAELVPFRRAPQGLATVLSKHVRGKVGLKVA